LYMDAIIEMEGATKPVCVAESIALVIE
jgi:hypothetical protein